MSSKSRPSGVRAVVMRRDLKPAALARTLIFFSMTTSSFGKKIKGGRAKGEDLEIMMAYLYAGIAVPAAVNDMLQTHIKKLLEVLGKDKKLFN